MQTGTPVESRPRQRSYEIQVVGAENAWFRDAYHAFLRAPWWVGLGLIVVGFLAINVLFGLAYAKLGGVINARPHSFVDGFCFSVQTMATIGYGAMYPDSGAAHTLVVIEAILGLLVTALCTGLIFAKFSQPIGRITYSHEVTISPVDGVPTLTFRVGNQRGNTVVEATIRVLLMRTMKTLEGVAFYRMTDLVLVRDRSPALTRSWNVMHVIDASSPLFGYTPERMAKEELEIIASLMGIDDTSSQPVHARHQYEHDAVVWGARHADILTETRDGNLVLDLSNFHKLAATAPTPDFPYPQLAATASSTPQTP